MRPSFHCATAWPFSAAYCSELSEGALAGVAAVGATFFRAWALRAAAAGCDNVGIVTSWVTGAPSNANPGAATGAAPSITQE